MAWQSWDGRVFKDEELSHQHLSNIYWMNILLAPESKNIIFAVNEIAKRFENKVLGYKPDPKFTREIDLLDRRGNIKWDQFESWHTIRSGKIKWGGNEIGEIEFYEVEKQEWIDIK